MSTRGIVSATAPISGAVVVHAMSDRYALDKYREELFLEDGARAVLKNIREMAGKRTRNPGWARLFCELAGWVGMREQIIAALVRELGVPIEAARDAVESVSRVPQDVHAIARINREFLAWYDSPAGPGKEAAFTNGEAS